MTTPWDVVHHHLINAGLMTTDGTTRRARATSCPRCNARILTGLDADLAAVQVHVDPLPLTPLAEALAILAGRRTAALVSREGRLVLNYRDSWRITGSPAGTPGQDVYAEHLCGTRPGWPSTATTHARPAAASYAGAPPF